MIILMGVAGAGKSLQGRLLADEKGYSWISTGEILRVLVTGKRRQEMLAGKLLNDEEMINMMDKVLDLIDTHEEIIFDGFPRTLTQANWLVEQVERGRFEISAVFHLTASESVVLERLQKRGRQDDTKDAIRNRFEEYRAVTLPIVKDFRAKGITVYDIDGSQPPEAVHADIVSHVN
jgi:adenylate kinase